MLLVTSHNMWLVASTLLQSPYIPNIFWQFLIIATAIWFVLFVFCEKGRNRNQQANSLVFIGYGIAAFGAGICSVFGVFSNLFGEVFVVVGSICVRVIDRLTRPKLHGSTFRYDTRQSDEIEEEASCPNCGSMVQLVGWIIKPDGSVICTTCMKKFKP